MSILASKGVCRLYYEPGHGGSITRNGVTVPLTSPPDLGRGPVFAVDYVPCSVYCVQRSVGDGHAELEPDEISAARRLIEEVPSQPAGL